MENAELKTKKVKTGSDCTANSGPFPNQYQHIYIYLTLQHIYMYKWPMQILIDDFAFDIRPYLDLFCVLFTVMHMNLI